MAPRDPVAMTIMVIVALALAALPPFERHFWFVSSPLFAAAGVQMMRPSVGRPQRGRRTAVEYVTVRPLAFYGTLSLCGRRTAARAPSVPIQIIAHMHPRLLGE